MSIERAASAVAYIVQNSTDVDFSTYFQTRLQACSNHEVHCKISKTLWETCEELFDINIFQCTCKDRFQHRTDHTDDLSCSPQVKLCSSKNSSYPDFFQLVKDCSDELQDTDDYSLYDISDGLPAVNGVCRSSQETEIIVQEVPNFHSSCDWFEDVLKEE